MMQKSKLALIIILIVLLAICISMMVVALLISERTFAQISAYIAIGCVVVALVGIVVIVRANQKDKKEIEEQINDIIK